ncbi:hypothetical protein VIBNISOn1_1050006 [Vibrio nigripulchritudo SOn1]|uniref:Uncharacterized protein n=1 Tax=Vibrio nigripulchritudo SOn1 TaxID=1238450 RepID=A0AAV2VHK7_9VIBR|nr:hypothetical protein VIBNISOn1_1050006 [Vibrio nigripulchritudo SOn1]
MFYKLAELSRNETVLIGFTHSTSMEQAT